MSDLVHCCEQYRASDRSEAVEILDRWEAVSSLHCSDDTDEQGVITFQGPVDVGHMCARC